MAPLAVVKAFDIFLYYSFRVGTGAITLMVHQFVFQAGPEALHGRVVVAVPPARHGRQVGKFLVRASLGVFFNLPYVEISHPYALPAMI